MISQMAGKRQRAIKKPLMKVVFSFESGSTFQKPEELASALDLPKVRDLRSYDGHFRRSLDAILFWETPNVPHSRRYYIADVSGIEQVEHAIVALRLMGAGFTGAYRYQRGLSKDVWNPLLEQVYELKQMSANGHFTRRMYELGGRIMKDYVREHVANALLDVATCNEGCINNCLSLSINVLRLSVDEIKIA